MMHMLKVLSIIVFFSFNFSFLDIFLFARGFVLGVKPGR